MGLAISGPSTTASCSYGGYSLFRKALAKIIGLGDLDTYAGFGGYAAFPHTDPLEWMIDHSDCEGELPPDQCGPIAQRLRETLPSLPYLWQQDYAERLAAVLDECARTETAAHYH